MAAIVNDDVITLSEVDTAGAPIYQEIQRRYGDDAQPEIARARREVLDQLVNQKLMEQVIEKYDITASEGEIDLGHRGREAAERDHARGSPGGAPARGN